MELEDQVCSYTLAKRLKELGVEAPSLFCWTTQNDLEFLPSEIRNNNVCISAYTVAELDNILPEGNVTYKPTPFRYITYSSLDYDKKIHTTVDTNGANCRAKMLIYLIENKLIEGYQ